jgi:antitoxin (DNA-binding transcriptional repressor) of toxin-antitoxin stability system
MSQATLSRQFIKDAQGRPIAVIVPIEEYALIEAVLEEHDQEKARKIQEIELAANDLLFLADLEETMAAFEATDAEWWERA